MEIDVLAGLEGQVHPFNQPALPANGFRSASRKVFPEFCSKAVKNVKKSNETGVPCFEDVEYVTLHIAGDAKSVSVQKVTDEVKAKYPQEYAHWKSKRAQSIVGWAIEQMPGLTVSQIAVLKAVNVHTVEQLSELSDSNLAAVGMGARELRAKAQFLVKSAKDNAVGMRQAAENENLRQEVDFLKTQIREIQNRAGSAAPAPHGAEGGVAPMREAPAGPPPAPSPGVALLQRRGWPKGKPRKPVAPPSPIA